MNEFICMNQCWSFCGEPISSPKFELQFFINFYDFLVTQSSLTSKRSFLFPFRFTLLLKSTLKHFFVFLIFMEGPVSKSHCVMSCLWYKDKQDPSLQEVHIFVEKIRHTHIMIKVANDKFHRKGVDKLLWVWEAREITKHNKVLK